MLEGLGETRLTERFLARARRLMASIERSLEVTAARRQGKGVPASPHRRLDAGAIGSLAVSYPLGLWPANERRVLETVEFLLEKCFFAGGFFQDMIHSGINAYLTLHVAQTLLRAGDNRFVELMQTVADLATPTGQWPEAIHPRTKGGCMGDGHHVWAAAEWIMMLRNCFVREEAFEGKLILASGIPSAWLETGERISLGPAPTQWGSVDIALQKQEQNLHIQWNGRWRGKAPIVELRPHGYLPLVAAADQRQATVEPSDGRASSAAVASLSQRGAIP
jgi:hypothetical protein